MPVAASAALARVAMPSDTRPRARVLSAARDLYSDDDRATLALLALPIFLMAFAIAASQAARTLPAWSDLGALLARRMPVELTVTPTLASRERLLRQAIATRQPIVLEPALNTTPPAHDIAPGEIRLAAVSSAATAVPAPVSPTIPKLVAPPEAALSAPQASAIALAHSVATPAPALSDSSGLGTAAETAPSAPGSAELALDAPPSAELISPPAEHGIEVAALEVEPLAEPPVGPVTQVLPPPGANTCVADERANMKRVASLGPTVSGTDSESFGLALAAAARRQLDDFVIYTDKYSQMSYPMGDVPALYGVCTDVIIRAYRAVGYDLQRLVHETRVGSGDTSIDHRRVDTLRRFFAKYGEQLPITEFAEDYKPGDIVTYYRPQNRRSRTHIAIVSDMMGASGRPMIIHNRGWGPQQEDALFVDQITGHFRYTGLRPERAAGMPAASTPTGAASGPRADNSAAVVPASFKSVSRRKSGSISR